MSLVDPTPGALVERYSWEIDTIQRDRQDDTEEFSQVRSELAAERERKAKAKARREEIQRIEAQVSFTRPNDIVAFKRAESELLHSMQGFQALVPSHLSKGPLPTSWEDVEHVVSSIQAQWATKHKESNVERAKDWVRKMCNGLNNHSTALKMLPSETEWVSVIAGSVSMIIKASANHIKVTESFAEGIIAINDAVGLVQRGHVYETRVIQQLTMRLYGQIFNYLSKFMKWFTEKSRSRFAMSFNENLGDLFQEDLNRVADTSRVLSQQIQYYMSADVKVNKLIAEETGQDVKNLLIMFEAGQKESRLRESVTADIVDKAVQLRIQSSSEDLKMALEGMMEEYSRRITSEITGRSITALLMQQATYTTTSNPELQVSGTEESRGRGLLIQGPDPVEPATMSTTLRVAEIEAQTHRLETYFDWLDVHPLADSAHSLLADAAFVGRLNAFTTTMDSQILYAHGRYRPESSSILQQSVAAYISLARNAGVQVISHFCSLPTEEPPKNRTRQAIGLTGLIYSLTRQIAILLPTSRDPESVVPVGDGPSSLDGTLRTWGKALSLFAHLAENLLSPILVIVIDGLNTLEDDLEHSTDEELDELVHCLMRLVDDSRKAGRMVKVLFSTAGISEPLSRELDEGDQFSCDMTSQRRAGRPRRGRQRISF